MNRFLRVLIAPVRSLTAPLRRAVLARFDARVAGLLREALGPLEILPVLLEEVRTLDRKTDRILELELTPEVLRDFRAHTETLRAIRADCDLIRELNPLANSLLRDLLRLQARFDEVPGPILDGDDPDDQA